MVLPLQYVADWDIIRKRKQKQIDVSNTRENTRRVDWEYKVHDLVLISDTDIQWKLDLRTNGPFKIVQCYTNGTIDIQYGVTTECVNIHHCILYHQKV